MFDTAFSQLFVESDGIVKRDESVEFAVAYKSGNGIFRNIRYGRRFFKIGKSLIVVIDSKAEADDVFYPISNCVEVTEDVIAKKILFGKICRAASAVNRNNIKRAQIRCSRAGSSKRLCTAANTTPILLASSKAL